MTTSLLNSWRKSKASSATRTHGLGVVAVHVEDRRLDHPARRRSSRTTSASDDGGGGEADLVVDDDVDRAAGAVAAQLREVQGLGHDALAGERRVAVHQERQDREVLAGQVEPVLLGAHDALEHRVDGLEVRGVGGQVDLRGLAGLVGERALGAEVVLHVAGALDALGVDGALELREDLAVGLARDVGQHVEPAAVRPCRCTTSSMLGLGGARRGSGRAAGWCDSPPSRLNRFCPTNLVCRKVSNASAALSCRRMRSCSSRDGLGVRPLDWLLDPGAAAPGPGCACTRCRPCGSTSRAARRGSRAASSAACRRSRRSANSRSRSQKRQPVGARRRGRGAGAGGTRAGRCRPSGGRARGRRGSAR